MMTELPTIATAVSTGAAKYPRRRTPLLHRLPLPTVKARVSVASVLLFLTAWQLAGALGLINVAYTSTPLGVLNAGAAMVGTGELGTNAAVTLMEFSTGYLAAVAIGVPLGMVMGWRLRIRQTFEPLLVALYVTPSLALMPIFVLALGIGTSSKIAIVFVEVVITIVINSMAGIRETDPRLTQAARAFCASDLSVFGKVLFPSALPTIVAGLRLGVGRGVIAVIVAELYGGVEGIGVLIATYGTNFQTAPLLFLVLLVGIFGYAVSSLLSAAQTAVSPWKR
jgi:ABC-type nitrate/sulfonate/bicarbonate transport system permease component